MADYHCWPLWESSPGVVGNIDPRSLPISEALREDLAKWASRFDEALNLSDPIKSGFTDEAAEENFKRDGAELRNRLQNELGPQFEVVFFHA